MSEPDFRALYTGDPNDDDPAVIESYLVEVDNPPEPFAGDPVIVPSIKTIPPTILRSGTTGVTNTMGAYPLVQQDIRRAKLNLIVYSAVLTDSVFIADDATKLEFDLSAARLVPVNTYPFDGHTGPLFVKPAPGNSGTVYVSWYAVIGGSHE